MRCLKGHPLNEDGLCGMCFDLNPRSPYYGRARARPHRLPPSSNAEARPSLCFDTCRFCNPKGRTHEPRA